MRTISILYSGTDQISSRTVHILYRLLDNAGQPVMAADIKKSSIPARSIFTLFVLSAANRQDFEDMIKQKTVRGPLAALVFIKPGQQPEPLQFPEQKIEPQLFLTADNGFTAALSASDARIRAQAENTLARVSASLLMEIRKRNKAAALRLKLGDMGGFVLNLLYNLLGRRFTGKAWGVNGDCDGCGLCVKACPHKALRLSSKAPRWNMKCKGCQACRDICPRKAIGYSLSRLAVFTAGAFLPYDEWIYSALGIKMNPLDIKTLLLGLLVWSVCFALFCVTADALLSVLERFPLMRRFFGKFLSRRRLQNFQDRLKELRERRSVGKPL